MAESGGSKEDCGGSKFSKKEENDMLLYTWQRAAFMDSGQGIPKEMADSLRLRVAQLSTYHTKLRENGRDSFGTEQLLKDYLDRYSRVMDQRDESKGMNNFSDTVHTLLAGRARVDRSGWKTGLELPDFKKLPRYQEVLEEAAKYSEKLPTLDRSIPYASASATTPSCSKAPPTSSKTLPISPATSHSTAKKLHTTNPGSTIKPERRPFQYAQPSGVNRGQKPASTETVQNICERGRGSVYSGHGRTQRPPAKRRHEEEEHVTMVPEEEEAPVSGLHAFSTARDEYARQQQRRFGGRGGGRGGGEGRGGGGGGTSAFNYGSSKKVLGTRRGFVPPVRRDPEMEPTRADGSNYSSEAEIRSRVLRGTGGGGGGGGKDSSNSGLPPELEGNERLKNIEPRMVELIMNEIMDHSARVQWDDIAGLEFAKATIKEIVVWPMMRPDLFTGLRGPPKGILLFGPPGTGKTLIGKCIASQVDATFFSISASSLTSKWIGEGEKMVRALFAVARCFQPAVIFMDEIDSLLTQRSDTEHESSRRIKTEFLVQLDGATTSETDRLLVIGATNRPQEIDEAARRRLVKRLYIPLPEAPARKQIVLNLMRQQPYHLSEEELEMVCSKTKGYSGADMANLCREAAYGPVREAAASIQHISASEMRQVLYRDFASALSVVKPSVSEKDLDLYIDWNRQFGCGGK